MKQLIEDIAKALVDIPEEVSVRLVEGEQVTVLELKVAPSDLGKVIGKQGRTARSIRTILGAASILLTNALFSVMASGKPSVTFSIVTATPAAVTMSATPTPAKPAVDVRIARRPY